MKICIGFRQIASTETLDQAFRYFTAKLPWGVDPALRPLRHPRSTKQPMARLVRRNDRETTCYFVRIIGSKPKFACLVSLSLVDRHPHPLTRNGSDHQGRLREQSQGFNKDDQKGARAAQRRLEGPSWLQFRCFKFL